MLCSTRHTIDYEGKNEDNTSRSELALAGEDVGSDSREEDVGNEYIEPGVQEKPTKADHGNVRKTPKGVGNGLSDQTRRRVTLQFKREYKLEMLVGIHSPTKVKKSWHFEAYGERMKEFVNFSATGKKKL
ncbi:hypothetical protein GHT06_020157 [Daphnia sinensis]|uniref:Uncharacterized protein n=1 Tax=Daphnia sinensis TaxID=1820382 RepID=A0AAD5PTQ9_9CRUS|nr:hypothetical protein GHT06_020157 [Daphnia sinensis]